MSILPSKVFKYEKNGGSINSDHIFSYFEDINRIFAIGYKSPQPLFGEERSIKSPHFHKGGWGIWFLCLRTIYRALQKIPIYHATFHS
jgi:hypothetical protein